MLPQKRSNFTSFSHYFSEKESKLRLQFHSNVPVPKSTIFAGVCVHVNGRTRPPLEQLRTLVLENGGSFEQYYHSDRVTHVLCTHIARTKWINATKEWQKKLTKPQWIIDCVEAGRMLDCKDYRLAAEEIEGQSKLTFGVVDEQRDDSEAEEEDAAEEEDGDMDLLLGLLEDEEEKEKDPMEEPTDPNITETSESAIVKTTTTTLTSESPGFLTEFYKNSRLHHLSRWRQEAKRLVSTLSKSIPNTTSATTMVARLVMHVDLDCFFVAVSLLKYPGISPDTPVVVCHGKGGVDASTEASSASSSDVSSCNYAARGFGIRNGMYLREALKLCPHLQCIQYDFEGYERVMRTFYRVLVGSGGVVEAVSCDEAYLLLPWSLEEASLLAEELRTIIRKECGIEASVGMGGNRLIARLATRRAKPAGQFLVLPEDVDAFVGEQRILDLPGIGRGVLEKLSIADENPLVSQLLHLDLPMLQSTLGPRTGLKLFQSLRGIDDRPLSCDLEKERKSVGSEVSWGIRFSTAGQWKRFVDEMCSQVWSRMTNDDAVEEDQDEAIDKERGWDNAKDTSSSTSNTVMATTSPATITTVSSARIPRKVAVKLYRRSPNAGDPKKFLGRGQCDTYHRTRTLPRGILNLTQMIDEVWLILQELLKQGKAGVEEVRGLGVFFSDFKGGESCGKKEHLDLKDAFQEGKGIDWEVLKELPEDIQSELMSNMKHNKRLFTDMTRPIPVDATTFEPTPFNTAKPTKPAKKAKTIRAPLNTLTQLWGHREVRQLQELQDRILALPDDSGLDKQVLLALPAELQREILEEEEQKRVRQGIKPSEEIISAPSKVSISKALHVTDKLSGISFKGRSDWSQFDLFKEVKESEITASFLVEVEELLVEMSLKECFKPVSELLCVLKERKAIELVEKIKKLVHDLYGFRIR